MAAPSSNLHLDQWKQACHIDYLTFAPITGIHWVATSTALWQIPSKETPTHQAFRSYATTSFCFLQRQRFARMVFDSARCYGCLLGFFSSSCISFRNRCQAFSPCGSGRLFFQPWYINSFPKPRMVFHQKGRRILPSRPTARHRGECFSSEFTFADCFRQHPHHLSGTFFNIGNISLRHFFPISDDNFDSK